MEHGTISLNETSSSSSKQASSTIVYATVGRSQYAFDVYSQQLKADTAESTKQREGRLTDGVSVNYNGAFGRNEEELLFVSERDGNMELYKAKIDGKSDRQELKRLTYTPSMQDRPLFGPDGRIIFASTHQPSKTPRQGWTAIYSVSGGGAHAARRLTPENATDYSPALSADGKWLAAATGSGRTGNSDVVIMHAQDGLERRIVARNGGWPAFSSDGRTIFFHRQCEDGWWSIFAVDVESGEETRLTQPGRDVFTPATCKTGNVIAVASPDKDGHRQIALLQQEGNGEWVLRQVTNRSTHHYNPFLSADGGRVGYHRCRCLDSDSVETVPVLQRHSTPLPDIDVVRIDGSFPSFSDDDQYIVFNDGFTGVSAVRRDGSAKKLIYEAPVFGTTASFHNGRRVIATAQGPTFASEDNDVSIMLLTDGKHGEWHNTAASKLTKNGTGNNAFPAFSCDGSEIVFRSGRSGYKNLYIMPAEGESAGLIRLTEGPWDDTMPGWTPAGGWIVFASSREYVGSNRPAGAFDLFMVRTDATGLRKLFDSHGGLANHPHFSPDKKSVVFTSDFAGYSAEEISTPHQFQPYGDLYKIDIDGTNLQRLTHDPYENGTPVWGDGPTPEDLAHDGHPLDCSFDDSVEWLRPKEKKKTAPVEQEGDDPKLATAAAAGKGAEKKWCPFTGAKSGGAEQAVSSSR